MTLAVEFNFTPADKRDPMSQDDCEVVNIQLDGKGMNWCVDRDYTLNRYLIDALHRLHEIMPHES
jgi:hypothetical protein